MKISPTLEYTSSDLMSSSYTLLKVLPQSGVQTGSVQINNGFDITFELPPVALNLSRSYLYVDLELESQAGNYTWMHKTVPPIEAIEIMTRGGQRLLSLSDNANVYSQVVGTADIRYDEFDNNDTDYHPFAPTLSVAGSQPQPGNGATGGFKSYADFEYCKSFNTTASTADVRLMIPLNVFKHTICDLDKSLLFNEILVFKIRLARASQLLWEGTSATNPDTGATTITDGYKFTNMALYVSQERNSAVVESLTQQVNSDSGFSLLCPYPSLFRNQRNAATSQSVTVRANKSHGQSLKSIKYVCYDSDDNEKYFYRDNGGERSITNYYTAVNNQRLQEFNIDATRDEDWLIHKIKVRGTPIANAGIYKYNWFHQDDFTNFDTKEDDIRDLASTDTNALSGLNLNQEVRLDIYATTASKSNVWYAITDCQKVLNINKNGLVIG
jgi:hypothetical protein